MNTVKSIAIGPKLDPSGTPVEIGWEFEYVPSTLTAMA